VNGVVIATIDGIRPLPKIEVVETIVARTCEGDLRGRMTPIVVAIEGV
jgi:hypothetical protein